MKSDGYDEHYLAMFQPGSENLEHEPTPVQTEPEMAANTEELGTEEAPFEPEKPIKGSTFNAKAITCALGAAMLVLILGMGCLAVGAWAPNARTFTPDQTQISFTPPWGITLAAAGAPLITGSLAAMSIILMVGSRQRFAPERMLRRCILALGTASLALAAILIFNQQLFPAMTWSESQPFSYSATQIWILFIATAKVPLTTLSLSIFVGLALLRPTSIGGINQKKAISIGGPLLILSSIMHFALHLFPMPMNAPIQMSNGTTVQAPPWTHSISEVASAGILVGTITLLIGAALMSMPRLHQQNANDPTHLQPEKSTV